MTVAPGASAAPSRGSVKVSPDGTTVTVVCRASQAATTAGRKFIRGEPMKPATKRLAGW
ncbi:hypothetical protein BamIOP4010DRAFT_0970 [Burkholderia ambifaria IOP40-10]|uniref:Uncharacterized protein n=1 Tax=Burkholderia ambifaria IOP40-10 TaxID=396596 RepID=B1FAB1_9BURK|nr:hypothetical protein BamIOP4010DRAFT_0970 [Burkholderia ambifaria IOP40-10]